MFPLIVKSTIMNHWLHSLRAEAFTKSSLKYLDIDSCSIQKSHPVWLSIECNPAETRQSIQKAQLMCGTYLLQSNKAVFNQYQVDPTCSLCGSEAEDRRHFILRCPTLADIRAKHFGNITSFSPDFSTLDDETKLKVLLDSNFAKTYGMSCDYADLEASSRKFIFSICCMRLRILNNLQGS